MFDHKKLCGRIVEILGSKEAFAKAMGLSSASVHAKLSGKRQFNAKEIRKACEILMIDAKDIASYFFTLAV